MLKFVFYLGLAGIGVISALISPLAGAIVCLEAYLLNPSKITGEDFGFRYQLLATAAFLAGYLLHRPPQSEPAGKEGVLVKSLWVFIGIALLSSLWAVVSAQQAVDGAYEVLKTILVASLLSRVLQTERQLKALVTACILGVFHAGFMHTFGIRLGYVYSGYGREVGVLPDGQNAVMILFLPLLVTVAAVGSSKGQRICAAVAVPFALNSIVSTYMRAGLVALAVESVALVLLLPKRLFIRGLPILAVVASLFLFRLTPDNYWDYMSTIKTPTQEASANSRFVIGDVSARMLRDYPMGVGYDNYADVSPRYLDSSYLTNGRRSAHNSFFSIACETGILGFAAWIISFIGAVLVLRKARRYARESSPLLATYAMGLEIGLYGWFVTGCFHSDHEADPAYWFVGIAIALIRITAKQTPATDDSGAPSESLDVVDQSCLTA